MGARKARALLCQEPWVRTIPLHAGRMLYKAADILGRNPTPPSSTTCSLLFQVLWIIPQRAVRWVLVMIALGISGSVLAMTFWPAVREDNRRVALATIVTILLLHVLLSVGCLVCCHCTLLVWF